jgi:uncharacterized membrane protein
MSTNTFFHRHRILRHVLGRPRLFLCAAIGLLSLTALPMQWRAETRFLSAWNLGVLLYIASAIHLMVRADPARMRRLAQLTDESRFVVLVLAIFAAVASIVAIVAQLAVSKDMTGINKALHLGLAGLTIVSSWTFIQVIFAQHYAHEYFIERASEKDLPEELRGGVTFPGTANPDFLDFLYFSFVIGVASQTADVSICSRPMRRVALIHCVLAFFFNTTVLALTINIAAGLI